MNKIQQLNLEIIKLSSFNMFDGEEAAKDLLANQDLWIGASMLNPDCPLIGLRDMDKDNDDDSWWNASTLYIKPVKGKENALLKMVSNWCPIEREWLNNEEVGNLFGQGFGKDNKKVEKRLLRLWWD